MKNGNTDIAFAQGIAVGHCTTWLETFAERSGVPFEILAERVGRSLSRETDGQDVGADNHVPDVRSNSTSKRTPLEQVAVAGGTHRNPQPRNSHNPQQQRKGELGLCMSVPCKTCGAKANTFCITLGERDKPAGLEMRTSVHTQRKLDAHGLTKVDGRRKEYRTAAPTTSNWTPERRKEYSDRMKRMNASGKMWRARVIANGR